MNIPLENAPSENAPLHPARGTFGCRRPGCTLTFDSAHSRNLHQSRCDYRCSICEDVTFSNKWRYDNHVHGHATGLYHRCRLGCKAADDDLWFDSEYYMIKHHLVEHGCSFTDARKALGAPWGYEEAIPVPLVDAGERAANLAVWNEKQKFNYETFRDNRTDAQAKNAATTSSTYKQNIKHMESSEQRAARLAQNAVYNKKAYDTQSELQRARRLERERGYDHARRASENEQERNLRLTKKAEHERKRLARMTEDERHELNVKRRATVKFAEETEAEREARVAPRRVANKHPNETEDQRRARCDKRKEARKRRLENETEKEREQRETREREAKRRWKVKQKNK